MKKTLFLFVSLLFSAGFAHAQAVTSFFIWGGGGIISDCEVPDFSIDANGNIVSGGPCVQKYYTDQGTIHVMVNGQDMGATFDGYTTLLQAGNDLASYISSHLGVPVATVQDGGRVRIDISGSYTLSNMYVEETSSAWIAYAGASWWYIASS